jgi:polyferredoxin
MSQFDSLWDLTPETLQARKERRKRDAQERSRRTKRRNRLYTLIWCLVIFGVTYGTLWAGGY